MADRKITELTAMSAGGQATGDLLTIVDVSEAAAVDKNKKITVESLFKGIPGNVGVGTSSPTKKLNLKDAGFCGIGIQSDRTIASQNLGGISFLNSSGTAVSDILSTVGGEIYFANQSSETMRIDSSGNVGIGTSSPEEILHIAAASETVNSRDGVILESTSALAADTGLPLVFSADIGGGFTSYGIASIAGRKENATSANAAGYLQFGTGSSGGAISERMRIDSSGVVKLTQSGNNPRFGSLEASGDAFRLKAFSGNASHNATMQFFTGANSPTERMRIDSSGSVGIGTSSPGEKLHVSGSGDVKVEIETTDNNNVGLEFKSSASNFIIQGGNAAGNGLRFYDIGNAGERLRIDSSGNVGIGTTPNSDSQLHVKSGANDNNPILRLEGATNNFLNFRQTGSVYDINVTAGDPLSFTIGASERMRITSGGDLLVGQTNGSFGTQGTILGAGGQAFHIVPNNTVLLLNRQGSDGEIVRFAQADVTEGNITVSGSTVSYNGGHLSRWSQLATGAARTEILRGSVLSNLDEMCEWGEEDNEQLNRMQVSSVEGDRNVSGVFQSWDDDDDTYVNDFYCAMTGDFVIRIAQGTTVARGDLLMSAGDGTAKPQDDDIVRSKTIAKVTSTTVSTTYSDNSYCVPCVLMAC